MPTTWYRLFLYLLRPGSLNFFLTNLLICRFYFWTIVVSIVINPYYRTCDLIIIFRQQNLIYSLSYNIKWYHVIIESLMFRYLPKWVYYDREGHEGRLGSSIKTDVCQYTILLISSSYSSVLTVGYRNSHLLLNNLVLFIFTS